MDIKRYVKEYTSGAPVTIGEVFHEVGEFLAELFKINTRGMKEEFQDVFHFLQLWLYWQFGINGKIWSITRNSVEKFMDRKQVWNKIYISVGLPENISGYVGNYARMEKVVNHLGKFGIDRKKAEEAYRKVVG